jgi:catechol 2,3-dioxygenase-like lactoylglutathione lyase family enzyme
MTIDINGMAHVILTVSRFAAARDFYRKLLPEFGMTIVHDGDSLFYWIVRGPLEGDWAPGYYYVLFEDPDGIRLEVNFVPGAGVLAEGASFNPSQGYR